MVFFFLFLYIKILDFDSNFDNLYTGCNGVVMTFCERSLSGCAEHFFVHIAASPPRPQLLERMKSAHSFAATRRERRLRCWAAHRFVCCATRESQALEEAACRVVESGRSTNDTSHGQRLLEDIFAECLLDASVSSRLVSDVTPTSVAPLSVVLARVIDAALLNAVHATPASQVVVFGAGGDTRVYRLPLPAGTRVFELAPYDAVAHAELAFARRGIRPPRGLLVRRIASDSSPGWTSGLLAAGYFGDQPSTWAVHVDAFEGLESLLIPVGELACTRSTLVGGVPCCTEVQLSVVLSHCGFALDAFDHLTNVAASFGRTLEARAEGHVVFSATKVRLSVVQADRMRNELQRVQADAGEEGFPDAP